MRCTVCESNRLVKTEYVTDQLNAPALQCARCGALLLDEDLAESSDERESIRRALAARQVAGQVLVQSRTQRIVPSVPVDEVEGICSEIDLAAVQIRLGLQSLEVSEESYRAKDIATAKTALERIQDLVAQLARRCASATQREASARVSPTS